MQVRFFAVHAPKVPTLRRSSILRGGLLAASRQERVRPIVATASLLAFLSSQCILPGALLLSEVHADEARRTQATRQLTQAELRAQEAHTPAWAKRLRAQIARDKALRAARLIQTARSPLAFSPLRLVQMNGGGNAGGGNAGGNEGSGNLGVGINGGGNTDGGTLGGDNDGGETAAPFIPIAPLLPVFGSKPGQIVPSADNGDGRESRVELRGLDLSHVPTEGELIRVGGMDGLLAPTRPAEPLENALRLDALLKRLGIGGLQAVAPANTPQGQLIARAKGKLQRVQDINSSFGEAMQAWNKHDIGQATKLLAKHLKDYPESPWAGEAALHLARADNDNGRLSQAQARYQAILDGTTSKKPGKDATRRGHLRETGADKAARRARDLDRVMAQSASPLEAIDAIEDPTDLSFETHQKARQGLAELDIAAGDLNDANTQLTEILRTDTDWRRLTWAQHWARNVATYKQATRNLRASGGGVGGKKKLAAAIGPVPDAQRDLGYEKGSMGPSLTGNGNRHGEPVFSVNQMTLNLLVQDTPLWYAAPVGPDVEVTMSYNAQDAGTQNSPFGNKWRLNYGSYVTEDAGGSATVFGSDGRQDVYAPDGAGGYTGPVGSTTQLVKLGTASWELRYQSGGKSIYGIPQGSGSQQPFLIEQRDRFGYGLHFGYDANVHLTTITDAQGKVTRLEYDGDGHIRRVWDPFGRHVTFSYDEVGNMVEAVDMEGQAFQYTYDSLVHITRLGTALGPWSFHLEGPDGAATDGTYPAPGGAMGTSARLTMTDPTSHQEEYFYDGGSNSSWLVDRDHYVAYSSGHNNASADVAKTQWFPNSSGGGTAPGHGGLVTDEGTGGAVFDGEAKIRRIVNAAGEQTLIDYDTSSGQPSAVTDARSKVARTSYNAQGEPTSITDPKSNVTSLSYAANGFDVTGVSNANGATVATYSYNALHQVTSSTDRDGTTTYTYTAWGAPASVTDPQNRVTTYNYNAQGQLLSTVRDGVNQGSLTYDEVGRVATTTDMTGLTLAYDYNNLDALTKVTYPDGTSQDIDYVCGGIAGVVKDRAGRRSYTDIDPLKRAIRTQDAAGNSLQFDYDAEGDRTKLVDAKGQVTRWAYDGVGRVTAKKYHDGTIEGSTYTQGLLSQSVSARGKVTGYGYDDNSNLTLVDYQSANMADVSMSYNALDDVTQVVDGVGTHTFSYDTLGRLDGSDGPMDGDAQSYGYDAVGRLASQSVQRGASGGVQSQSYGYDALDRLQTLNSNGTQGSGLFTYSYVGNTDLLSRLDLPNGTHTSQSYDALQRLTSVQNVTNSGVNLSSYAYGYDAPGQPQRDVKTSVTSQLGSDPLKQVAYGYDAVDQLTGEQATGGAANSGYTNTFTYDAMGNRTKLQNVRGPNTSVTNSTPNALNQLTSLASSLNGVATGSAALDYDAGGNLTQSTGDNGTKALYSYDDNDRLTRVEGRDAAGTPTHATEFVYDYAGRKVISREFSYAAGVWSKTGETRRVYDDMDVVQERNDQNQVTAQYTRDGNIGGILARTSASGHSYFHYDGGGNVTALSDENGNLVGRYSYDAFGNTVEVSGARAAENPYRFSTKEYIAGMVDYGYRFYLPGLGRWLNRDPLREDGGVNLYCFVNNSSANAIDPNGLSPVYIEAMSGEKHAVPTPSGRTQVIVVGGQPLGWGSVAGTSTTISGGTVSERTNVALMVEQLYATEHASSLSWSNKSLEINLVRNHGTPQNPSGNEGWWDISGNYINLNLNSKGMPTNTTKGPLPTSLRTWLGHEMGHALGHANDDGPNQMNNVLAHDNELRGQLGVPLRISY